MRAERMAELGLVRMLHPDGLTPAALMAGLQAELAALAAHQRLPQSPRLDGLARVSAAIFDAIDLETDTAPSAVDTPFTYAQEAKWLPPSRTAVASSAC